MKFEIYTSLCLISQIAKSINQGFAESGIEYRTSAKALNQVLLNEGLLELDADDNKVASDFGDAIGIVSVFDEENDFYRNYYDSHAQKYVIETLLDSIPWHADNVTSYEYGRRIYRRLFRQKNCVILLESEDRIWSYEESADIISDATNIPTYKNEENLVGLCFDKSDYSFVYRLLIEAGNTVYCPGPIGKTAEFAVIDDSPNNPIEVTHIPVLRQDYVEIGDIVTIQTDSEEITEFELCKPEERRAICTYDVIGNKHFITPPEISAEQLGKMLSVYSPLGREIIGKCAGDSFVLDVDGTAEKIKILKIVKP